jgi:hypothetical protein
MAEMGDLTTFFKDGSGSGPAALDWLNVDEKDYQALDKLPKQNLDVTPDLKALWSHEDKPSTGFVPNTGGPRTMGDLSQAHGPLRKAPEDLLRTARLAIMQTVDPSRIQYALTSRYDSEVIKGSRTALASVFAERGLLGRYYLDASDFPDCRTGSKKASEFARRFTGSARFVLAKAECNGCIHRQGGVCGVFHKQIVMDVPYSEELASQVENLQQAKGRAIQASQGMTPRERIRTALLAQTGAAAGASFSGRPQAAQKPMQASTPDQLISIQNLTKKRVASERQEVSAQQARPIVAMLRREMLKGRTKAELSMALRLAFDERDLRAAQAEWGPIYKEAGLYGVVYTTQDSFDDCREGADFLARYSSVRAVVAGPKCESCLFNKVGRCLMYGKKLIGSPSEIVTAETTAQMLDEHKLAGRLHYGAERLNWGSDPATAIKALHEAAMTPKQATGNLRSVIERAYRGGNSEQRTAGGSDLTKRTIVQAAQQYMNEGLYGQDLVAVLRGRFEVRDLASVKDEVRTLLAEQGLQGIKYVDPRVYDDYGNGCHEAGRRHRSRTSVRYAKVGDKCTSCVHQTRPGHCSVLNKQLVVEPPYLDKRAEQRAILATGSSMEVPFHALVNNGLSMMYEYQLQQGDGSIDLSPETRSIEATIEFGRQGVKL